MYTISRMSAQSTSPSKGAQPNYTNGNNSPLTNGNNIHTHTHTRTRTTQQIKMSIFFCFLFQIFYHKNTIKQTANEDDREDKKTSKTQTDIVIHELIREYMEFHHLENSLSVYEQIYVACTQKQSISIHFRLSSQISGFRNFLSKQSQVLEYRHTEISESCFHVLRTFLEPEI